MPATVFTLMSRRGGFVAAVMIGVDPHKGSHTAVAVGADERQLGKLRVLASDEQARQLAEWAAGWPERTWAVEGASGLGHLLAQQLVAAGERVLDVQPKLGSRVRLLASGNTNKNDPNDARSVAIAALRSADCRQVRPDDHTAVLQVWSKRHRDLGRSRNQVACRLHAVLCELVPGGVRKEITAAHAARLLEAAEPSGAVALARWELAGDFLEDLRRLDGQMSQTKKKLAGAVKASGTTVTEIFGVGPVIAAIVLGEAEDVSRFRDRDRFAAYNGTAPVEVSSGNRKVHRLSRRGNRRINHAVHMAAITQIRHAHSEGRAYYDKKIAEGKSSKEALRALKRRISDALYRRLRADARRAASTSAQVTDPGGQAGNGTDASAADSHPECRLFGTATPGPEPTLRPASRTKPRKPSSRASKK
jgi:transposase